MALKIFIPQIESVTFPDNEYNIKTSVKNFKTKIICMLFDC